jgi:hypothetical protein
MLRREIAELDARIEAERAAGAAAEVAGEDAAVAEVRGKNAPDRVHAVAAYRAQAEKHARDRDVLEKARNLAAR